MMADVNMGTASPAEQRSDGALSDSSSRSSSATAPSNDHPTADASANPADALVVLVSDDDEEAHSEEHASHAQAPATAAVSAPAIEDGDTDEHFPTRFDSWEAFRTYLREFCDVTYQAFRNRGSVNITVRNNRLPANSPWRLPLTLKYYYQNFVCTHAVTRRSRSKGQRPRMASTRSTGCDARINATLTRDPVTRSYFIKVAVLGTHNHPVGRGQYMAYAENRRITDPELLRVIETMSARGEKTKAIQEEVDRIVRETTGEESIYTRKHIYNIIYRFRTIQQSALSADPNALREHNSDDGASGLESALSGSDSDSNGDGNRIKRRRISNDTVNAGAENIGAQPGLICLQKKNLRPRVKLSRLGVLLDSSYCYDQIQNVVTQVDIATVALYPGTLSGFKHQLIQLSATEKPDDVSFVLPHYVIAGCESGVVKFCGKYELKPQDVGVRVAVQEAGSDETQLVTLSSRQLVAMKRLYHAQSNASDAKVVMDWIASSGNLEFGQFTAPFDDYADYTKDLFAYSLSMMPLTSPAVSGVYRDIRNVSILFTDTITSANLLKAGGADSNIGDDFARAVLLGMHSRFHDLAAFLSPSFMRNGALADRFCAKASKYGALLSPKRLVAGVAQLQSGRWGGVVLDCSRDVCVLYAPDRAERKELQHAMSGLFTGYRLPTINFEAHPQPPPSLQAQPNDSGILALLFVELMVFGKVWEDLGEVKSLDYFRMRYLLQAVQVVKKQNIHDIRWS